MKQQPTQWNDEELWTEVESDEEQFFAALDQDVEDDEMSLAEAGFIKGYRKMRAPGEGNHHA